MIYRGQVLGDVIVLEGGVRLPEGSAVLVEPIGPRSAASPLPSSAASPLPGLTLPGLTLRNGVPVFPANASGGVPDLHLVNELRDDAP
jgi:hypothetical protein